jgi:uncharacterized protein
MNGPAFGRGEAIMLRTVEHSKPVNVAAFDDFLISDQAPTNLIHLSDLDGFLTGIAIGPEPIPLREWLPVIWRGETLIFDDADEAWRMLSPIVMHYKNIISGLENGPEGWTPVFGKSADGRVIVSEWAAGFLDAMDLRSEAWAPLFEDREAAVLMVPMLLAGGEHGVAEAMGIAPADESEWLRQADRHIPVAVTAIDAFWKERRNPVPSARTGLRRPRRLRRRKSHLC